MERLGIFGGTFDPVHVGHLAAASAARHHLELARVLVVVAGDPWQKRRRVMAPAQDRYEMVVAAIDGTPGLEASRLEVERPGPTRTIDTVETLQSTDRELYLIVGGDVAVQIDSWTRAEELRQLVTLAIVDREHEPAVAAPRGWQAVPVPMPRMDVSSTDLRRRVAAGAPVEFLIPTPAVRVLHAHGLYTSGR